MTIYEGMFLLDNDLVRAGWAQAKSTVTALIEKHGGKVHASRRWGERKLAYRVKRRNRATYLLTHYEMPTGTIQTFQRDLEIAEPILRYMFLRVEEVPAEELELTRAEEAADFVVPEPPADEFDEVEEEAEPETPADGDARASRDADSHKKGSGGDDAKADGESEETTEAKSGETTEPAMAGADGEEKKES